MHKNSGGITLAGYTYTLADDGMRESVTVANSAGTTRIIKWYYDNLNRLIAEDYNAPSDANDFVHDYVYDIVGNRLTKTVDDVNVTQYYYNDNDQLLQETTDGNSIWYDYDENGAVTFKDAEDEPNATYVYDLRGRLAQVQAEYGNTVDYLYNHAGIRVRASVGASDIDYIIDPYNHTGHAQVFKEIKPITDTNTVYISLFDTSIAILSFCTNHKKNHRSN